MKKEEMISMFEVQKTTATILKIEDGKVIYRAIFRNVNKKIPETQQVFFHIPFSEINGTLENTIKVDSIIQWLVI